MNDNHQEEETTSISIKMPREHLQRMLQAGLAKFSEFECELHTISRAFVANIRPETTILLYEDDVSLRAKLKRYFAGIGCQVFECETLIQAEMILRDHSTRIDHFIFDLIKEKQAV